jgi:hypothetical protein
MEISGPPLGGELLNVRCAIARAGQDRCQKGRPPAANHQGPEVVVRSVRASSIRAIAIMTSAVETNRILGSPPSWCVTPPCLPNCMESFSSRFVLRVRE